MSDLREKGKLPPSSDSSPGALPLPTTRPRPRAQRSANLRNKGRLPESSDSSPGAFPIPRPRAERSADGIRPTNALPPAPEPIHFDEEECKEDEEAAVGTGAAESEGNVYDSNSHIAENIPAAIEARAYAIEGQEDIREPVYITVYQPPPAAEEPKKWHERPFMRVLLVILLVVGVVALVMYLSKPAGVTPIATPEPTTEAPATPKPTTKSPTPEATTAPPTSLTPEPIACNFLSIPDLTECRSTVEFIGVATTGSTIPSEIALLSRLTFLDISNNELTGTIPTEMGLMHQLTVLLFYNNQLTGRIPSEIGALTQLTYLGFYVNELTGTIPSEMGLMQQLTVLGFDSNELTGAIPSEIGELTQLTVLSFAGNDLSGTMPSSLCSLTSIIDGILIDCGDIACASGCCLSGEDPWPSCG